MACGFGSESRGVGCRASAIQDLGFQFWRYSETRVAKRLLSYGQ